MWFVTCSCYIYFSILTSRRSSPYQTPLIFSFTAWARVGCLSLPSLSASSTACLSSLNAPLLSSPIYDLSACCVSLFPVLGLLSLPLSLNLFLSHLASVFPPIIFSLPSLFSSSPVSQTFYCIFLQFCLNHSLFPALDPVLSSLFSLFLYFSLSFLLAPSVFQSLPWPLICSLHPLCPLLSVSVKSYPAPCLLVKVWEPAVRMHDFGKGVSSLFLGNRSTPNMKA